MIGRRGCHLSRRFASLPKESHLIWDRRAEVKLCFCCWESKVVSLVILSFMRDVTRATGKKHLQRKPPNDIKVKVDGQRVHGEDFAARRLLFQDFAEDDDVL